VATSGPLRQYVLEHICSVHSPHCRAPHSHLDYGYLPHCVPLPHAAAAIIHQQKLELMARTHLLSGKQKLAGPRLVPVELGKHYLADGWTQKLMPFDRFLDRHVVCVMTAAAGDTAASAKQQPAEQQQPTEEQLVAVQAAKRPRVSEEHPLGKHGQMQPASEAVNEPGA
jgi:hypothetical protein